VSQAFFLIFFMNQSAPPVSILPPVLLVLLIPVANLLCQRYRRQICRRCQQHRWQIATGTNDTGGKFATGQWHRWQLMGTISGCRHLKVTLKAKIYINVKSSIQRCPNKIIKNFLIEDFFPLPPVSTTPVVHLELQISPRMFEKNSKRP
jgi:hypothetical protein